MNEPGYRRPAPSPAVTVSADLRVPATPARVLLAMAIWVSGSFFCAALAAFGVRRMPPGWAVWLALVVLLGVALRSSTVACRARVDAHSLTVWHDDAIVTELAWTVVRNAELVLHGSDAGAVDFVNAVGRCVARDRSRSRGIHPFSLRP